MIRVYVNSIGEPAFAGASKPQFPVGAVSVKEKYTNFADNIPELVTVMIKHSAGYDPKNGDWEFNILSGDGKKVLPGTRQHCQDFHRTAHEHGYLFRSYIAPRQLR